MIKFHRYKNGALHILTMSYDDGSEHDRKLVEIFDKYGIRGTFNLNSGRFDSAGSITRAEIPTLYKNHEVAVHTVNHPWLEKIPDCEVLNEILNDRKEIEKCCNYPVRGMAYPFGTRNQHVIDLAKSCGIVYSRTADCNPWFGTPANFMEWQGTCHHNDCIKMANEFIERSKNKNRWFSGIFYVWGHSHEFNGANNWDVIEEFCKMMSGRDDTWYATNIEIYDYIQAQHALQISMDEKIIINPTNIDVWIEKDGETVKIPAASRTDF